MYFFHKNGAKKNGALARKEHLEGINMFPFSRSLRVTSDDRRIGISPERPIHFECN